MNATDRTATQFPLLLRGLGDGDLAHDLQGSFASGCIAAQRVGPAEAQNGRGTLPPVPRVC